MKLEDFKALGDLDAAGLAATRLALDCAAASGKQGRIPIAGAAVAREADGTLRTVTVGCNGRIPADDGPGYPTDHGETAALRGIEDFSAWDWSQVVFATTLSPCIMCTRSLLHLHTLGLRRVVIAESQSFPGEKERLRLPGVQLVELTSPEAIEMMERFSRRWPWDWAADIGGIPPLRAPDLTDPAALIATTRASGEPVGVVDADGVLRAAASDERARHGGNPVYSAAMLAMGRAGSAINLRDCALVFADPAPLDLPTFGASSLGACELFRPAALVAAGPVSQPLRRLLEDAEIRVIAG